MRCVGKSYYRVIKLSYDLFSRFYDAFTLNLPNYSKISKIIIDLANPSMSDYILDVACGTGILSIPIAMKAGWVVGLDISRGQLHRLKHKANLLNISLIQGDAERLPFRDDVFNISISSGALSEIINKNVVIGEMYRVLRKNGRIVIMTFNRERIPFYPWAYNRKELIKAFREVKLKKIRIKEIAPFYLLVKASK
ncbi:MAG TPA: methyltransferase domain-containing protein [Thermoprotei archaeon]|nr:methyltransferase domain-containing protein [Thermoprotei archaeon]